VIPVYDWFFTYDDREALGKYGILERRFEIGFEASLRTLDWFNERTFRSESAGHVEE
jgi:hypothetical protein